MTVGNQCSTKKLIEMINFSDYTIPGIIKEDRCMEAAVFIPVIEIDGTKCILFEVRSSKVDNQTGDVCLPGGRIEDGESPADAAVRETCEELLIDPDQLRLTRPVNILVRHSLIMYPFLGELLDYSFTFDEEVKEVFTVPVDFFVNTKPEEYQNEWKITTSEDFPFDKVVGGKNYNWPKQYEKHYFYEYNGRVIWGYTAKILKDTFFKY